MNPQKIFYEYHNYDTNTINGLLIKIGDRSSCKETTPYHHYKKENIQLFIIKGRGNYEVRKHVNKDYQMQTVDSEIDLDIGL